MPNSLITAFVEGLTETLPFRGLSVKTNRLNETLWTAVNDTNLKLRLPLYWDQLRKPRPKKAVYDASIQAGLAVLGSFAMITNTKQAIVRIEHGNATAVSFQPRPFGEANWTRDHGIMPVALQNSYSDPLLERDRADGPIPLTMDVLDQRHPTHGTQSRRRRCQKLDDDDVRGWRSDVHLCEAQLPAGSPRHLSASPGQRACHGCDPGDRRLKCACPQGPRISITR